MPTTDPDEYFYPDGDYTGGFRAAMGVAATSQQAAMSARFTAPALALIGAPSYPDAATRDTDIPSPVGGEQARLLTEFFTREWRGGAWRPVGGLVPVTVAPVGGTQDSTGWVNFTNATTVVIDSIPAGDFHDHLFIVEIASRSSSADITALLRTSGADAATGYAGFVGYDTGTARTVAAAGTTSLGLTIGAGTGRNRSETRFDHLTEAAVTGYSSAIRAGVTYGGEIFGEQSAATARDGLKLTAGGTITFTGRAILLGVA